MQPLTVANIRLLVGENAPFDNTIRIRAVGSVPGWRRHRVLRFVASHGCVEVHADDPRVGGFVRISHEDFAEVIRQAKVESDPLDPVSADTLERCDGWARTRVTKEYTRLPAFASTSHTTFPVALNGGSHVLP